LATCGAFIRKIRRSSHHREGLTAAVRALARQMVFMLQLSSGMLKLIGSYALAKLLGFGLVGAIVIYALLTLLT
jgi:hypothetical protein